MEAKESEISCKPGITVNRRLAILPDETLTHGQALEVKGNSEKSQRDEEQREYNGAIPAHLR
jgi:hypothetical protein